MHRQVTAERSKRAEILESEGQRQSAINVAEGRKQSVILASEALKSEQINMASGEAEAILLRATATARGVDAVAQAMREGKESAQGAVSYSIAEKYVEAFGRLAKEGTAVVVPGNVGDMSGMIASAMAVYGKVSESQRKGLSKGESQENSQHTGSRAVGMVQTGKSDDMKSSVLESFEKTRNGGR